MTTVPPPVVRDGANYRDDDPSRGRIEYRFPITSVAIHPSIHRERDAAEISTRYQSDRLARFSLRDIEISRYRDSPSSLRNSLDYSASACPRIIGKREAAASEIFRIWLGEPRRFRFLNAADRGKKKKKKSIRTGWKGIIGDRKQESRERGRRSRAVATPSNTTTPFEGPGGSIGTLPSARKRRKRKVATSNVEERRRGIEKEYKTNWPRSRLARSPLSLPFSALLFSLLFSLFFLFPSPQLCLYLPRTIGACRLACRRVFGRGRQSLPFSTRIFNLYVRIPCRSNQVTGTNSRWRRNQVNRMEERSIIV